MSKLFVSAIFFLSFFLLKSQEVYVFNSGGESIFNINFSYISSVAEPVTSVGKNIENGFLSKKIIQNTINEDVISIFPNPSYDELYVSVGIESHLKIFNQLGQVILEKTLNVGLNRINLSQYSDGVYYLSIINNSNRLDGFKLIKL